MCGVVLLPCLFLLWLGSIGISLFLVKEVQMYGKIFGEMVAMLQTDCACMKEGSTAPEQDFLSAFFMGQDRGGPNGEMQPLHWKYNYQVHQLVQASREPQVGTRAPGSCSHRTPGERSRSAQRTR